MVSVKHGCLSDTVDIHHNSFMLNIFEHFFEIYFLSLITKVSLNKSFDVKKKRQQIKHVKIILTN